MSGAAEATIARRDAEVTRQIVVRAARTRFARSGYGDVTIRDVADDAGVSAALVMKYFGSKEQLFVAAADLAEGFAEFLDAPDGELGRHMVEVTLALQDRPHSTNPFLAALFMAGRPDSPAEVTDDLREAFVERLTQRLSGRNRTVRAELITAQVLGLSAMVRALVSPALAGASPRTIIDLAAAGIQRLVDVDA